MKWGDVLAALAAIPFLLGLAAVGELRNLGAFVQSRYDFGLPAWAPAPLEPEGNPTTAAKVELGRRLFYDARLSRDGTMSCASCHIQELAFTDGRATSPGVTGQLTARNSMSLANAGYQPVLTWANPLMHSLEQQALVPLIGQEPVELGLAGMDAEVRERLQSERTYRRLFREAFPDVRGEISLATVTRSLAAFQRTIISVRSPYDRYRYEGDVGAVSDAVIRGEALFFSERLECHHCHNGLHFSDTVLHERNLLGEIAFHNTGLYNIDGRGAYPDNNTGIAEITGRLEDMGRFRAPSLRNVAVTAPYMHDGSIATLDEVLDHYAAGGRTILEGSYAGVGRDNPLKSSFVPGFDLSAQERSDLIAFLQSLTDEQFLRDPRFSNPWTEEERRQ
ncbi:methanobactin export MATE transporter MbnM [Terricaulis sp.]|uniref:methanobactin export MATE transporter MbnM n=1 Tax=Terricaulis sp. TaxID=2768686 RepID=UPI002AC43F77|nr:methanobactin export MATE transporter MbnM [Terricaulis sp.]MDZ4689681.1 di-heme enzyme [Terricaulis sp.]